jgi:peptide/nickel transport system substrate-binding protein
MASKHGRRLLILPSIAVGVMALLVAFAASGSATTTDNSTLTVAVAGDVQTLDPAYANFITAHWAIQQMFDTPVNLKPVKASNGTMVATSSNIEPDIFKSWTVSKNGLVYTAQIRKGITFHSGAPVTAQTVAWTFDRNLGTKGGMNWLLTNIAFIKQKPKVLGPYTIQLTASKPSVLAMQALYMDGGGMLNPANVQPHETTSDPWAEKWLATNVGDGTGPFILTQHIPDQELVFQANDKYFLGAPKLKQIIFKIVPSSATRLSLLKAGAVDIADGLTPNQLQSLKTTAGVKVVSTPSDSQLLLGLNNNIAPFNNKTFRQAVEYAINYNQLIQSVYHGAAQRTYGPVSTSSPYAIPTREGYQFNLAKAKQLIQQSGYNGQTITLSIDGSRQDMQDVAVNVQSELAAAGIKVQIQQLTPAVFAQQESGKKLQMYADTLLPWISDPDYVMSLEYQCGVFSNYVGYCNKSLDNTITKGWAEKNASARHAMFLSAQKQVLSDAPYVWIAQPNYNIAMRSNVQGFVHRQNEIPWFYTMYKTSG